MMPGERELEEQLSRDLPGRYDGPERPEWPGHGAGDELSRRLSRLPPGHPSAPGYGRGDDRGEERRPGDGNDRAGGWIPAAERPEWRKLLERGEVDQVGLGIVDERASRFQPRERRLADYLAGEGCAVVAVHDENGNRGRKPDTTVDGVRTEFKCLDQGATNVTVKGALNSAKGQAREVIVDARGSGLEPGEADRGLRRFQGSPYSHRVDGIRIIGDDYDKKWKRG
jgi:hypothetical protein